MEELGMKNLVLGALVSLLAPLGTALAVDCVAIHQQIDALQTQLAEKQCEFFEDSVRSAECDALVAQIDQLGQEYENNRCWEKDPNPLQ
jgi:hypothetical protein